MVNHARIAREFIAEQLDRRDDIVAALVFGSVARGEATETSDIDLAIYVAGDPGAGTRDLSCWREGVFLEAGFVAADSLGTLDEVMRSPIDATHLNDALVVHDPQGRYASLQRQVRAVFMDERWLATRLAFALALLASARSELRTAVAARDELGVVRQAMMVTHGAASVPLYLRGVTPSSTRKLALLAAADPRMRAAIAEYECSLPDAEIDGPALVRACELFLASCERPDLGGLSRYMTWKARSTIAAGAVRDGIDMLWCAAGMNAPAESAREGAREPMRRWLELVGWSGTAALEAKERRAAALEEDAQRLAGDPGAAARADASSIIDKVIRRTAPV